MKPFGKNKRLLRKFSCDYIQIKNTLAVYTFLALKSYSYAVYTGLCIIGNVNSDPNGFII